MSLQSTPVDAKNGDVTLDVTCDRIDVHAQSFYRQVLIDAGYSHPDGIRSIPEWDADSSIRVMDSLGVAFAILSISGSVAIRPS